LVEQVAVNHPVGGSSPSRGANKESGSFFYDNKALWLNPQGLVFYLLEADKCHR
jgi:hypothetical protein